MEWQFPDGSHISLVGVQHLAGQSYSDDVAAYIAHEEESRGAVVHYQAGKMSPEELALAESHCRVAEASG